MTVRDCLLGDAYRFLKSPCPTGLSEMQAGARDQYLKEMHGSGSYTTVRECPYCGYGDFTKISEVDARGLPADIVICDGCGGCFKSNVLSVAASGDYYAKISRRMRGKPGSNDRLFNERVQQQGYPRYHFINSLIRLDPARDTVAELGCSDGANLYPWKQNCFRVHGMDFDAEMVRFGRGKGLDLIEGDISGYRPSGDKPKLIIMSHVLEHAADLNSLLKVVSEAMGPEGYLFIEVPGVRGQGIGRPLNYMDIEHNYYFDAATLAMALKRSSLEAVYIDEYIRAVCVRKGRPLDARRLSGGGIIADVTGIILGLVAGRRRSLLDLMKEGEKNSFRLRLIRKSGMPELHYRSLYASIIKEGKSIEDIQ
jgi:SAM-dependent methyltransferase